MAECLTVDQDVAGSTPVSHPKKETEWFLFLNINHGMENL